jgi:hypothetical protein
MHGLIRQVARFSCVTLGSIAGGVLGFVAGFLVAFAIGKSAFELASVYRPAYLGFLQADIIPRGCVSWTIIFDFQSPPVSTNARIREVPNRHLNIRQGRVPTAPDPPPAFIGSRNQPHDPSPTHLDLFPT